MNSLLKRLSFTHVILFGVVFATISGLLSMVVLQAKTIDLLKSRCNIETLMPIKQKEESVKALVSGVAKSVTMITAVPPTLKLKTASSSLSTSSSLSLLLPLSTSDHIYSGVAFTLFLGSPKWFQNRYTMMVNMLHGSLPANWVIQIFYLPNNKMSVEATQYPGIQRQIRKGNVILTPIPETYRKLKKKDFLVLPWVWESLVADRTLTFGGTNVLCANSPNNLEEFSSFGYIGTPWNDLRGLGGDGGLSLRNRTIMLDLLQKSNANKNRDDVFFVKQLIKQKKSEKSGYGNYALRPDTEVFGINDGTKNFSIVYNPEFHNNPESDANKMTLPFGAQGTLSSLSDMQRIQAIDYCPEIKMVFPVLHSSSCFGAAPNPLKCFKFLCEFGGLGCNDKATGEMAYFVSRKNPNGKKGKITIEMTS